MNRQRVDKHIPAATNTQAKIEESVSKQRIGKQTKIGVLLGAVFLFGPREVVIKKSSVEN
jgi:hypothetical protein